MLLLRFPIAYNLPLFVLINIIEVEPYNLVTLSIILTNLEPSTLYKIPLGVTTYFLLLNENTCFTLIDNLLRLVLFPETAYPVPNI